MKAVVLCAGKGTRLGALTRTTPKPMLPIHGRPLLEYTIEHLARHGFGDIAVNLHYHADQIRDFFGNGERWGVNIYYSVEQELRGTAGALIGLDEWLDGEPCLVFYGDILTDQNLSLLVERHSLDQNFATLLLHRRAASNSMVAMDPDGQITDFEERPSDTERRKWTGQEDECWANSGVQVLSPSAIRFIVKTGAYDLPRDVYAKVVKVACLGGVPLTGFRVAIDSPRRYEEARAVLPDPVAAEAAGFAGTASSRLL